MRGIRHVVNVMRPTFNSGGLGETQGQPSTVCKDWPCKIKPISGSEQETARQNGANAQFTVEGHGDPKWTDLEQCYLTGGTIGERKLGIGYVNDENMNGLNLTLFCGETK